MVSSPLPLAAFDVATTNAGQKVTYAVLWYVWNRETLHEFDKIWHRWYTDQGHPDLVPFNFLELAKTKGWGERDIS